MALFKKNKNLSLSIALTLLACAVALAFRLFSEHDLPFQVFAAIIGVIITAIITQVLLNGQSEEQAKLLQQQKDIELEREIKAKQYEEKLRIYQEFLQKLCDVVKDGVVTKEEARELQFQTAYITMHTDNPERITKISECVKAIIDDTTNFVGRKDSKDETSFANAEADILEYLFVIVEEFKSVLYDTEPHDKKSYTEAIKNFEHIIDAVDPDIKTSENTTPTPQQPATEETTDISALLPDFVDELEKRLTSEQPNWEMQRENLDDGLSLTFTMKNSPTPNFARLMINHDSGGEHYYQIHLEYDDTHEAYKHMKWTWGGRQNKWSWWSYLDGTQKYLMKNTEFQKRDWDALLSCFAKKISEQMNYIDSFARHSQELREPLKAKIGERARVWMWYADVVAIDYNKTLPEAIFFDVEHKDSGYRIVMGIRGNNDDNTNQLRQRVKDLGLPDKELTDKRYIVEENLSAHDAIERLVALDKKIK